MTLEQIKDTVIKPKLIESFGNTLGNVLLINSNSAAASCKTDKERLTAIVAAICSNDKVKAMWGASLAAKRKTEWESLL